MLRPLTLFPCLILIAGLTSCIPDKNKREEQMLVWKNEIKQADQKIAEMKSEKAAHTLLAPDWKKEYDRLNERKIQLDGQIQENDVTLRNMKEERDAYVQRLEEFRITHPIN